jgi:hypothetical protein
MSAQLIHPPKLCNKSTFLSKTHNGASAAKFCVERISI